MAAVTFYVLVFTTSENILDISEEIFLIASGKMGFSGGKFALIKDDSLYW